MIEAHRLLKNSISSNSYALLTKNVSQIIGMPDAYKSRTFNFSVNDDVYDGKPIKYLFSEIKKSKLKLTSYETPYEARFHTPPDIVIEKEYDVSAQ